MKALVHKISFYGKVFFRFKKINFQERLIYRFSFILMAVGSLAQMVTTIVFFSLIYGWVKAINGWDYYQMLLIVGTVMLVDGLLWASCAYAYVLRQHIRMGTLDGLLTKPMDSQFLISVYRGDLEDLVRVIVSFGVLVFAISHLPLGLGSLTLGLFWFLLMLVSALIITYSVFLILNSVAFWTVGDASTFSLGNTLMTIAHYPIDIFSNKIVRYIFTLAIPIAFWSTYPAKVLTSGFDWRIVGGSFLVALVFLSLSRLVWKKGLAKYSSASS